MKSNCCVCTKEFEKPPSYFKHLKNPDRACCSKPCYYISIKGENNPNTKKWTEEQKEHNRQKTLERLKSDPEEFRRNCAKARTGKEFKFTDEHKKNMSNSRIGIIYSDETKRKIGIGSKKKFESEEYNIKFRKKMEDIGKWIPLDDVSDYNLYYRYCEWYRTELYFESKGYNIYEDFGLYSGVTGNLDGVVRDHIFSRKNGFDLYVFPEILKHPCNLQFISNKENIIKKSNSDISIDELFENITKYNGNYFNHSLVINLIALYVNGKRYKLKR